MKKPSKVRTILDDKIPLRGLLKCHCGNPLSGAPSKGKSGKWFYYYKCRFSKHNNISAIKAHDQFLGACELMSITEGKVKEIRNGCRSALDLEMEVNKKKIGDKKQQLEEVEEKLFSVEEKWIKNEISRDTFDRWHSNYNHSIKSFKGAIERLGKDQGKVSIS